MTAQDPITHERTSHACHIDQMMNDYERGRMSRRQLVMHLGALFALASGAGRIVGGEAPQAIPTEAGAFEATELNHIALRVTDVGRSRDFYMKHLGLKLSREGGSNAFLTCGKNFVALFRGSEPGLDHYCYSVKDFDARQAEQKLRALGLANIRRSGDRIYFDDPDGLTVQIAAEEHLPR